MNDLLGPLMQQLGGANVDQIARQIGAGGNRSGVESAIGAAIPMILGGLAKNSANRGGADALANALGRDHDGSLLENLTGYLSGAGATQDDGILGHIFGNKRSPLEGMVSQASGLDKDKTSLLMNVLAPIIMAQLGKAKRTSNLDANGVSVLLGQERQKIEQTAPSALDGLSSLLDSDGDGDIKDDLLKHGASLLGRLFSGRR